MSLNLDAEEPVAVEETPLSKVLDMDEPAASEEKPDGTEGAEGSEDSEDSSLLPDHLKPAETEEKAEEDSEKDSEDEKLEIKAPESSRLTEMQVQKIADFAKAMNMNQEQAQQYIEDQSKAADEHFEKINAEYKAKVQNWRKELQADSTFGGANLKTSEKNVEKFFNEFSDKQTYDDLKNAGLLNHPGLFRALNRVIKASQPDSLVHGSRTASTPKTLADVMDME